MFRRGVGSATLEFFLAHPGGPFWANREDGAWTIPKGGVEAGEEILAAALREFQEETGIAPSGPFISLGSIRQRAGKIVHAWAWEGDADPSTIVSNSMTTEWPRGSGRRITFPEIDRCGWFDSEAARGKINAAQGELLVRLEQTLGDGAAARR
jgi:predicted NUDIX family NTP pyrophosphohydrolase